MEEKKDRRLETFRFGKNYNPPYRNKEWLEERYVTQNKTLKEIADEADSSIPAINKYVKKFELKRSEESAREIDRTRVLKQKATFKEKYGVENAMQVEGFRKKQEESLFEAYGVRSPLQSEKIKDSFRQTSLERYGVEHASMSEQAILKQKETMLMRYGVENSMQNPESKRKAQETNIKRYGGIAPAMNKDIAAKAKKIYAENNGIIYNGKFYSKMDFAKKFNVSLYWFGHWIRSNPNYKDEDIDAFISNFVFSKTNIEAAIENYLGLKKWDKKVGGTTRDILNYRPDFKLSDSIYLNTDGLYWHSSKVISEKNYHFLMREKYESLGLRIFQFRSDEVETKIDIIKSIVENSIGKTTNKVHGRKTKIEVIDSSSASNFYEKTHLMGPGSGKYKNICLKYNEKIVTCMSYRLVGNKLIIERLSSELGTAVNGGFSKLLSYLETILQGKYSEIHYWVDLRYGTGNFLINHGFKKDHDVLSWKWTDNKATYNRLACRANMDSRGLSEKEHAVELKWNKIYDAGQRLYVKKLI